MNRAFGDAGYQGRHNFTRSNAKNWRVAMRPGRRQGLDLANSRGAIHDHIERLKASIPAKTGHSFRVIRRQFWFIRVHCHWSMGNTAQRRILVKPSRASI